MTGLPTIGGSKGTWATELNAFLSVAHRSDGNFKGVAKVLNVHDYYNGEDNHDAAAQAALAQITDNWGGIIFFEPGREYNLTATLTAHYSFTELWFGGGAARTYFNPVTSIPFIDFNALPGDMERGSVCGLHLLTNNTQQKIGIRSNSARELAIEDVYIQNWCGNKSIGINIIGTEQVDLRRVRSFADRPIVVSMTSDPDGGLGNSHWTDLYLYANDPDEACIHIDSDVVLAQLTIDGHQSWCAGKYGFYWPGTGDLRQSIAIKFANVRREQATDTTAYSFYLTGKAIGIFLDNCYCDTAQKGIYIRNAKQISVKDSRHPVIHNTESANMDSSCDEIVFHNFRRDTTSNPPVMVMTGLGQVFGPASPSELEIWKVV
jgi:hypothetical protein